MEESLEKFSYVFTTPVADLACFRKTSEMAGVESWVSCKFRNANDCKVLCCFIFISVCDADSLFVSKPFVIPKFKNKVKLFLQCHFLIIYFHSANHDTDRHPLVMVDVNEHCCLQGLVRNVEVGIIS